MAHPIARYEGRIMELDPIKKLAMAKKDWRVFTGHKKTQDAITRRIAEQGNDYGSAIEISHGGKSIPTFIVDSLIVLWLEENKHEAPYFFTAYHSKRGQENWIEWRGGRRKPTLKDLKKASGKIKLGARMAVHRKHQKP